MGFKKKKDSGYVMSKKKPEAHNAGWNCQECGPQCIHTSKNTTKYVNAPNCGFTVIRRKY